MQLQQLTKDGLAVINGANDNCLTSSNNVDEYLPTNSSTSSRNLNINKSPNACSSRSKSSNFNLKNGYKTNNLPESIQLYNNYILRPNNNQNSSSKQQKAPSPPLPPNNNSNNNNSSKEEKEEKINVDSDESVDSTNSSDSPKSTHSKTTDLDQRIKCEQCLTYGHLISECTLNKKLEQVCYKCGDVHNDHECPNVLCHVCLKPGHISRQCTQTPSKKTYCIRCTSSSHFHEECEDRGSLKRYLNIHCYICGQLGHLFCEEFKTVEPLNLRYCCNCGSNKHVDLDCTEDFMDDSAIEQGISASKQDSCTVCGRRGHTRQFCPHETDLCADNLPGCEKDLNMLKLMATDVEVQQKDRGNSTELDELFVNDFQNMSVKREESVNQHECEDQYHHQHQRSNILSPDTHFLSPPLIDHTHTVPSYILSPNPSPNPNPNPNQILKILSPPFSRPTNSNIILSNNKSPLFSYQEAQQPLYQSFPSDICNQVDREIAMRRYYREINYAGNLNHMRKQQAQYANHVEWLDDNHVQVQVHAKQRYNSSTASNNSNRPYRKLNHNPKAYAHPVPSGFLLSPNLSHNPTLTQSHSQSQNQYYNQTQHQRYSSSIHALRHNPNLSQNLNHNPSLIHSSYYDSASRNNRQQVELPHVKPKFSKVYQQHYAQNVRGSRSSKFAQAFNGLAKQQAQFVSSYKKPILDDVQDVLEDVHNVDEREDDGIEDDRRPVLKAIQREDA